MQNKLILVRHGQSEYNLANRFTGAFDSPLTERGKTEAKLCANLLSDYTITHSFASGLSRSQMTLDIILSTLPSSAVQEHSAALNERDYGDLTGFNKQSAIEQYGAEQVHLWRRSFVHSPPGGESLSTVKDRVVNYYQTTVIPHMQPHSCLLVVAHGNSLRALIGYLLELESHCYEQVEVSWCTPWIFSFEQGRAKTLQILNNAIAEGRNSIPTTARNIETI